jgi:hypothetical protein
VRTAKIFPTEIFPKTLITRHNLLQLSVEPFLTPATFATVAPCEQRMRSCELPCAELNVMENQKRFNSDRPPVWNGERKVTTEKERSGGHALFYTSGGITVISFYAPTVQDPVFNCISHTSSPRIPFFFQPFSPWPHFRSLFR